MKHAFAFNTLLAAGLIALLSNTSAHATAVPGQGTWEATLQARDVNGDGTVDAYYDTSSNLTWLADANLLNTSGYTPPYGPAPTSDGKVIGYVANQWIASLNSADLYGASDWRLPTLTSVTTCGSLPHSCEPSFTPGTSELANLVMQTLGNDGSLSNTGPFRHVQAGDYFTGAAAIYSGGVARWFFDTKFDTHSTNSPDFSPSFVWLVRTGDIAAAVPEPSSYALALCGLALVGVVRRGFAKRSS